MSVPDRRFKEPNSGWVTATEIASFFYCPEQWRLQHALRNASQNVEVLKRGEELHVDTARLERHSRVWRTLGLLLFIIAIAVIVLSRL